MSSKGTWHKVFHPIDQDTSGAWWWVLTECHLNVMVMPPHAELPKGPIRYCSRCAAVELLGQKPGKEGTA